MILYDGEAMHDDSKAQRCWKTVAGDECGEPATTPVGLCTLCLSQMVEAPVMAIPGPPSQPFVTGCGRR